MVARLWGFVTAMFCGFAVFFPLSNTDIFWHLASGREMIARGAFLRQDPFSLTPTAAEWINVHWLFQLVSLGVFESTGALGVVMLKCVFAALTVWVLGRAFSAAQTPVLSALFAALLIFESRFLVLARPTVWSLLILALFLWRLEGYRKTGNIRSLFLLIPLQMVWTNVQGLFILGPAVILLYASGAFAGRATAAGLRLAGCAGLTVLASVVNPYGYKILSYPFLLFGRINPAQQQLFSQNVAENAPLWALFRSDPRLAAVCLGSLFLLTFAFWKNRKAVPAAHVLLGAAFALLGVLAARNLALFFPLSAFLAAHHLGFDVFSKRPLRASLLGMAVLLAPAVSHARTFFLFPEGEFLAPFRYPVEAVRFLRDNPQPGNLFNAIRDGGYLAWALYPDKKVFVDGRLVLRTPEFFAEYLTILDHPHYFPAVQDKWNLTHAVLPTALYSRYLPLAKALYRDPAWKMIYLDESRAVFSRSPGAVSIDLGQVRSMVKFRWGHQGALKKEAYAHLNRFLIEIGEGGFRIH